MMINLLKNVLNVGKQVNIIKMEDKRIPIIEYERPRIIPSPIFFMILGLMGLITFFIRWAFLK